MIRVQPDDGRGVRYGDVNLHGAMKRVGSRGQRQIDTIPLRDDGVVQLKLGRFRNCGPGCQRESKCAGKKKSLHPRPPVVPALRVREKRGS